MAKPLETLTESELKLERQQLENAQALSDTEKQRLKFVLDRLSALDEERSKTKDLANSLSKILKLEASQSEILKSTVISFKEMGERASSLYKTVLNLKNPSTIFLELLNLSVDRFIELDKAGQSFRETTGFLADQTSNVEITLRRTSRDLATFGVNIENSNAAAQKIAETFSSVSLVTDETVGHVALMEKNLGVSVDDSTAIMQNFMGIGQLSSTVANQTAAAAASLSKAAGVPFSKVMKDVAAAGGEAYKLIRGSVDALIKGAIEARRLGLELKDVAAAADKFLDFQTSINSEMEASVLFGRDINFTKARELSYAGDLAGLAKEQSRILKEVGGLRKLDAFQTKALAESMGLSVDQLIKMNAKQEELNQLRRDNPDLAAQYEKDLDVLNATNETLEQKAKREIQSRQIASQQQKIMNDIQQIMVELSEILLPIVKLFVGLLVPIIKVGAAIVKFILTPIRWMNDGIDYFLNKFGVLSKFVSPIAEYFQKMTDTVSKIFDTTDEFFIGLKTGIGVIATVLLIKFSSVFDYLKGKLIPLLQKIPIIGRLFTGGVPPIVQPVVPPITKPGLGPPGMGGYGSTISSPQTPGTSTVLPSSTTSIPPAVNKTAGQNIKDFLKNLADGIKSFNPLGEILKGLLGITLSGPAFVTFLLAVPGILAMALIGTIGPTITKGFTALADGIKTMNIAKIGMGILGIGALGLAFGIFVLGLRELIGVNPNSIIASVAALYAVGGAALFLGSVFSTGIGAAAFFAGVAGIAALGLAMIPFGNAAKLAGEGMINFGTGIKDIASNISQIVSLEDTLSVFKDDEIISGIYEMGDAIGYLNNQLSGLGVNLPALTEINKTKSEQNANGEVVAKLDELISLMKNGGLAVNLNGRAAGNIIANDIRFRGASGIS